MTNEKRQAILDKIRISICTHGYHVTVVQGGPLPRFCYTIGLHDTAGFELVFAGAALFSFDEILEVVQGFARRISCGEKISSLTTSMLGTMRLQEIEPSWGRKMLLGALDYLGLQEIRAFQIIPDPQHWTVDVPNMNESWDVVAQPIWRWLDAVWEYSVSPRSKAITNIDALQGQPITEVMRWEESEWELFAGAGPDVDKKDVRVVPLGTMLGHDDTLECVVDLNIGSGIWRDDKGLEWHRWGS